MPCTSLGISEIEGERDRERKREKERERERKREKRVTEERERGREGGRERAYPHTLSREHIERAYLEHFSVYLLC
jgi:hypothetical protein